LPVIAPPVRVSAGPAAAIQSPSDSAAAATGGSTATRVDPAVHVRIDADPLQFIDDQEDRLLDVGVGYVVTALPDVPQVLGFRHGASLSARYHFWTGHVAGNQVFRASVGGHGDVLFRESGDFGGGGGTLSLGIEFVTYWAGQPIVHSSPRARESDDPDAYEPDPDYESDPATHDTFVGFAYGEVGVGLNVEAGWHALDDGTQRWLITGSLTVRLPFLIGLFIIPVT